MSGTIPKGGTLIPSDPSFGIINDFDQVGGWASVATESAIGAIATGRLVVNGTWRTSRASAVTYLYTSSSPAGGFANGTWAPQLFGGANGSFTPGVQTVTVSNDSLSGLAARNGYTPVAGDRILVAAQTSASANGIYVAASGGWSRASDANSAGAFIVGKTVFVLSGTNAGYLYGVTVAPTVFNTDPISFASNSSGGAVVNWASPGAIGSVTPNSGAFLSLLLSGAVSWASGTVPILGGSKLVDMSGDANRTVLSSEYCATILNIAGAWTASRKATLPLVGAVPGFLWWIIKNGTTGGFAATVGGSTGASISIPPGGVALVLTDGTDFFSVSGGGGDTTDATTRTSNFTCNATDAIVLFDTSGGILTATLPASPTRGMRRILKDDGLAIETNAVTIASGSSAKVQHPTTAAKSATSVACGTATGSRNGTAFEYLYNGTDWICLRS